MAEGNSSQPTEKSDSTPSTETTGRVSADRRFEVWSKSEEVAIHFNDLLMRWRLQAVGGLAALATLAGFVAGDADTPEARYIAVILLSAMLVSGWVGVAVLDLFYYRQLLNGAVSSLLRLERTLPGVKLSTEIDRCAKCGSERAPWVFYACGLLPLLGALVWGICSYTRCAKSAKESHDSQTTSATARHKPDQNRGPEIGPAPASHSRRTP